VSSRYWRTDIGVTEELNARFRSVVAFVIAAVFTAALLRHSLHVYGGISREEIREDAITALIPAVSFLLILLARKRRSLGD
jgi:hypothetical protein